MRRSNLGARGQPAAAGERHRDCFAFFEWLAATEEVCFFEHRVSRAVVARSGCDEAISAPRPQPAAAEERHRDCFAFFEWLAATEEVCFFEHRVSRVVVARSGCDEAISAPLVSLRSAAGARHRDCFAFFEWPAAR